MASEAYHDWSGEAAGARLRVNFMLKIIAESELLQLTLNEIHKFASNIGPTAVVPAGPAPAPLIEDLKQILELFTRPSFPLPLGTTNYNGLGSTTGFYVLALAG